MRRAYSLPEHLGRLRDRIFAGDNRACYIERERILRGVKGEAERVPPSRRYSFALERLLAQISTPIEDDDVFLGRMVEERWDEGPAVPSVNRGLLPTRGHLTLDWPTLLTKGLSGVVAQAEATAARLDTDGTNDFADNAAVCARSVAELARRYARAAREKAKGAPELKQADLLRAAAALDVAPHGPACDLFSALQAIWLVHLVTSCCIGARDFAFGRLDRYLLPFYEQGLEDGSLSRESATALLAHFLMKTNEITGTATWNHGQKPIPCQASKQYLMLAGRGADGTERANELTELILDAAKQVQMPQPVLTVCMNPGSSDRLKDAVAAATPVLGSQIHFYNDRIVQDVLVRTGLPPATAAEYTMGGCCRLEIGGVTTFLEKHHSLVHWLLAALNDGEPPVPASRWWLDAQAEPSSTSALTSWDDVLDALRCVVRAQLRAAVEVQQTDYRRLAQDQPFHFESLLLRDCVECGKDCESGGSAWVCWVHYFDGIATVANSLYAIKKLVFDDARLALPELLAITRQNFAGNEALREEIVNRLPKFGNDCEEVDAIATGAAGIVLDAFDDMPVPPGHFLAGGFYSLNNHHHIGGELPATPDGRLAGEPISENQSPSYGTDTNGVTALLKSVARLPLDRTAQGGLNVTFGGPIPPQKIRSLIDGFFGIGGLHVGFSFVDRQTLVEARRHPERYRGLTVRMYGFSEYFVSLSPHEQQELIARTRY